MDVGRAAVGIVHAADPHEPHGCAGACVIAPHRNLAFRAARDALAFAAGGRRVDDLRLACRVHDAVGLIHRVERVRRSSLALAPAAMAGMDDHRLAGEAIADVAAGAAAFGESFVSHDAAPRSLYEW